MSHRRESARMRRARKKRRILILKIVLILMAILLIAAACIYFFIYPKVTKELTREAGSSLPEVSDFVRRNPEDAVLLSGLDESVDMNTVADYTVVIQVSGKTYNCTLHVVDTVKPVVTVKSVKVFTTGTVEPESLIENIEDATSTTVVFAETPDFSQQGTREVKLRVTDEGGNVTEVTASVEVVADTEPPVIEGVKELTIPAGSSVSYKRDVTVTDNYDENVTLEVDTAGVDLNTIGDYPITYRATDAAGNVTEVSTVLHVKKASVETATEEYVNAAADKLLAQITTSDMSQKEVAKAIFWWVHENIAYVDGTPKTDWIQGAYRGLIEKRGDCYTYAMTSKCLLTQAGITNMDIEKIPAATRHYWNLIDIGEGWYHFDATRRKDGKYFFYTSDEDLMAYSRSHKDSHNYDPTKYPKIQ